MHDQPNSSLLSLAREIENVKGRLERIEDELKAERSSRATDTGRWKAGLIGVAFALLLNGLNWLWHHLKLK